MRSNREIILHLALIPTVGPAALAKLLERLAQGKVLDALGNDLVPLYHWTVAEFQSIGFTQRLAQACVDGLADHETFETELVLMHKHSINFSTVLDVDYPFLLKHIYLPPAVLFWQGRALTDDAIRLAVVGSRKANSYGAKVINMLLPQLVASGVEIVSGGALGIDTLSHQVTLDVGGFTQVVLGSGLLQWYPSENRKLFSSVLEKGGTMVSAFACRVPPERGNFPARNRIIAGLSQGSLIVQAPEKSGALITAQFALDQGRTVFAVPGSIDDELSRGCHNLIMQGATLVTSAAEIALGLGLVPCEPVQQSIIAKNEPIKPPVTKLEHPIVALLESAIGLDELAFTSGLEPDLLYDQLFSLQLAGLVRQTFTGQWIRT